MEVEPVLEVLPVEVGSMLAMDEGFGRRRLVAKKMVVVHVMPRVSWATIPVVEREAGHMLAAVVGVGESVGIGLLGLGWRRVRVGVVDLGGVLDLARRGVPPIGEV